MNYNLVNKLNSFFTIIYSKTLLYLIKYLNYNSLNFFFIISF